MQRLNRFAAFCLATPLAFCASLSVSPDPAFDCSSGLAKVMLTWSGASGPVEVRVNDAKGPTFTGLNGSSGTATTGFWVPDGMMFYLVNQAGAVEATAKARVRCGGSTAGSDVAFQSGSFFPLQVGNTWIYRVNSRSVTSSYVVRSIARTEELGGQTYFVLTSDGAVLQRLRGDSEGRIWRFTGTATSPKEELLLDPQASTRGPFASELGSFPDAASQIVTEGLGRDDTVYVRGVGLMRTESRLLSGSSGGFSSGLYLVEARLDGIRLGLAAPRLSVSIESPVLDVTGKKVTNCAIPYYCVACGLIGADGPGVYKPCAQARVEANATTPFTVELELADAAGQVVFRGPQTAGGPGDAVRYIQLQLYAQPNAPFPPGTYSLTTRLRAGAVVLATATAVIQIL